MPLVVNNRKQMHRTIVVYVIAALFYSLIESAKLCGVEPRAYPRRH